MLEDQYLYSCAPRRVGGQSIWCATIVEPLEADRIITLLRIMAKRRPSSGPRCWVRYHCGRLATRFDFVCERKPCARKGVYDEHSPPDFRSTVSACPVRSANCMQILGSQGLNTVVFAAVRVSPPRPQSWGQPMTRIAPQIATRIPARIARRFHYVPMRRTPVPPALRGRGDSIRPQAARLGDG